MKPFYLLFFLISLICLFAFSERKEGNLLVKSNDTLVFHYGNGLRDRYIYLMGNGCFRTYFFCDICPGIETFGRYKVNGDTLLMTDTILYTYRPHFSDPKDTLTMKQKMEDQLFIGMIGNKRYLYHERSDFELLKQSKNMPKGILFYTEQSKQLRGK